jgi:hypothetical protein
MRSPANRVAQTGAAIFVLWGVLHLVVGLIGAFAFASSGPAGVFSGFGAAPVAAELTPTLVLAGHIALDFSLVLAGYGVLAIWAAVLIWRGQRLGFWLNTVMLGIADGSFIIALMLPGFISPAAGGLGPVLYVLGVAFTAIGFYARRASTAVRLPSAA